MESRTMQGKKNKTNISQENMTAINDNKLSKKIGEKFIIQN